MAITLNGETLATEAVTVADLLVVQLGDPLPRGIAVAVNREVVPRADWVRSRLVDGDVVELVTAVAGG